MSARGNAAVKPIGVDPSKLEAIKQGKKLKSETGATQNKKVTVTKSGDKIIAVEKEKKFEEAGVTRKEKLCHVRIKIGHRERNRLNSNQGSPQAQKSRGETPSRRKSHHEKEKDRIFR